MMRLPDPAVAPEFYQTLPVKRLLAWCIDLAVTLLLVAVVVVMTAFLGLFILPLIWLAVSIAYRTVLLSRFGATLGMMLVAIRLRHLDGRAPEPMTCLAHAALFSFFMASILGQIASVAAILVTPYRQSLGDLMLGTTMINRFLDE